MLYLMLGLAFVGLVFVLVTLALLDRLVLSRLARLGESISRIGVSGDLSARVSLPGSDELAHQAKTINHMLDALENSHEQRAESDERYRAVVEQASEGIFLADLESRRVLDANKSFLEML